MKSIYVRDICVLTSWNLFLLRRTPVRYSPVSSALAVITLTPNPMRLIRGFRSLEEITWGTRPFRFPLLILEGEMQLIWGNKASNTAHSKAFLYRALLSSKPISWVLFGLAAMLCVLTPFWLNPFWRKLTSISSYLQLINPSQSIYIDVLMKNV